MFSPRDSELCAFKLTSPPCFMHNSNNASMFVASTSEFPHCEEGNSASVMEASFPGLCIFWQVGISVL